MKMDLVSNPMTKEDLLELAHDSFGLDSIFRGEEPTITKAKYILDQSWFVTFCTDDYEIYALLILEWVEERRASLHFCMFNRGNILKGWKMFLDEYSKHFDELLTYIPVDREDVLRLSKKLGFKHEQDKEFYYGRLQVKTKTTTPTTSAATTPTSSGTSNN